MSVRVSVDENRVEIAGRFNEAMDQRLMLHAMQQAKDWALAHDSRVWLDLSQVESCNSLGLRAWLILIEQLSVAITYANAPIWLVYQFNMIKTFFRGDVEVDSICAVFYREDDDSTKIRCLKIGTDIPILENYDSYSFPSLIVDGESYEPDFDPPVYFDFLRRFVRS